MTASEGSEKERIRRIARTTLFGAPTQVVADRYEVLAHIGRGGLGDVYRCRDRKLRRDLALKFVRARRQRSADESELFREAIVLARLSHPNIVPVYDVGFVGDEVFIAMALVEGETLSDVLDSGPVPWQNAVRIFLQVADALAAAHNEGIVHGDVKPQNLMIDARRRVSVLDFGLARELAMPSPTEAESASTRPSGTLGYLAPERHDGILDARTDQFAYAVALYRTLWGELPIRTDERATTALVAAALARKPPARVPRWLVAVLRRALAPAPADRFPTMAALRAALARGPGRLGRSIGGGVVVAATVVGAWLGIDARRCLPDDEEGPWSSNVRATATSHVPVEHAAWVAQRLDDYAAARSDLSRTSCEALAEERISGLLHDLRHACIQRQDFTLRHALQRSSADEFEAWDELRGAMTELVELDHCRADAVLLEERPRDADPAVVEAVNRGIDVAYVELMLGNPRGYLEELERVERELDDPDRAPVESLWLASQLGSALNIAGRHEEAAKRLRIALRQAQRHPRWRRVEGKLLSHLAEALASMRSPEAIFFAESAVATLEGTQESEAFLGLAWRAVAIARLAAGDPEGVLAAIDAARSHAPPTLAEHESVGQRIHLAATANLRGLALERLGRAHEAEAEYRAGIDAAGVSRGTRHVSAQLRNNLGLLLRDAGHHEVARVELTLAADAKLSLGDDDGHAASLMNLANLELAAGNRERALAHYDRALASARAPATLVGVHFNRGVARQQAASFHGAIADYDRVIDAAAASPRHRWAAQLGRGQAWLALGEKKRARDDLENAASREPSELAPGSRAELRLALATAIEYEQPARALKLALEARAAAEEAADPALADQARTWLAAHGH